MVKEPYDKFGHCIWCGKDNHTSTTFRLNTNSKMKVNICVDCDREVSYKHYKEIMDRVVRGWEKEIEDDIRDNPETTRWTPDRVANYMNDAKSKQIKERL